MKKYAMICSLLLSSIAPVQADGKICGGLQGAQCNANEFCDYPISAMCGAADDVGTCKAKPKAVTLELKPVCGCDDKTYPNKSTANSRGISVAAEGKCKLK
jgi:hypothetical protein